MFLLAVILFIVVWGFLPILPYPTRSCANQRPGEEPKGAWDCCPQAHITPFLLSPPILAVSFGFHLQI